MVAQAAEARQAEALRRHSAIRELAALDKSEFDPVLRRVLRTDAQVLGVARVNCWTFRQHPRAIVCLAGYLASTDSFEGGMALSPLDCPRYFEALAADPIILAHDASTDPRTSEFNESYLAPHGITSLMDVPIWVRGTLWGVVCHEHVGPSRLWTEAERDFALSIGHILSMAVEARERAEAERLAKVSEFFVAVLSHDLRNPLSTVRASADLLLKDPAKEAREEAARRIIRNADRMSRMVEQLLDFTRIRLGAGLPVRRESMDLSVLCGRMASDLALARGGRTVQVKVTGDTSGWWDRDRVWQLHSNLVSNALEHGERGQPVRVSLSGTDPQCVIIRVVNRGRIPDELLPHAFEPFRQDDRGPSERGGLGLGLFIAREIVAAHAGTINLTQSDGETVVTVRLPRRTSAGPA